MATRPTGVQARFLGLSHFRPNSRGQFSPKPDVYEKFKGAFFIVESPPCRVNTHGCTGVLVAPWQASESTDSDARQARKLISLHGVWAVRPAKPKKCAVWCDVYLRSSLTSLAITKKTDLSIYPGHMDTLIYDNLTQIQKEAFWPVILAFFGIVQIIKRHVYHPIQTLPNSMRSTTWDMIKFCVTLSVDCWVPLLRLDTVPFAQLDSRDFHLHFYKYKDQMY